MKNLIIVVLFITVVLSVGVPELFKRIDKAVAYTKELAKKEVEKAKEGTYTTKTSWYSRKECVTPSNKNALMANGEPLDDSAMTCASWDYPFGTLLRISTLDDSKTILVKTCDRGPARRLHKKGRTLDLTKAAFSALAPLQVGVIEVQVCEVK